MGFLWVGLTSLINEMETTLNFQYLASKTNICKLLFIFTHAKDVVPSSECCVSFYVIFQIPTLLCTFVQLFLHKNKITSDVVL